ncbi:hypothetical protein [Altererythrobacter sp.]|uniref:hypothetical protein n=1 Tax=Altererythrobacter sp. TaxID=1872480 RepID=UPI003D0508C2
MAAASVSGCASSGSHYPSLAIRDAERVQGSFAVAEGENQVPVPAPAGEETLSRVQSLVGQAHSAHDGFLEAVSGAERAVNSAAGQAVSDNSWASAQVALADLESQRSNATLALGDLDLLYTDATLSFMERDRIDSARNEVQALIGQEDDTLARLWALLVQ